MGHLRKRSFLSISLPGRRASRDSALAGSTAGSGHTTPLDTPQCLAELDDPFECHFEQPPPILTPGEIIELDGFGGNVAMSDGQQATLNDLVNISVGGVILFTYPQADTPVCTRQACLFRDAYQELRHAGFAVYGVSRDSPRANEAFKMKYNLPYMLICDQDATLIGALGFRHEESDVTVRGVIAIDKCGKVLASLAGGAQATIDAVRALIQEVEGDEMFLPPRRAQYVF